MSSRSGRRYTPQQLPNQERSARHLSLFKTPSMRRAAAMVIRPIEDGQTETPGTSHFHNNAVRSTNNPPRHRGVASKSQYPSSTPYHNEDSAILSKTSARAPVKALLAMSTGKRRQQESYRRALRPDMVGNPAAGRWYIQDGQLRRIREEDDSSSSSSEIEYMDLTERHRSVRSVVDVMHNDAQTARKAIPRKAVTIQEHPTIIDLCESDDEAVEELMNRLAALSFSSYIISKARLQQGGSRSSLGATSLPFLRRNLRVGFRDHCRKAGIQTAPKKSPSIPCILTYKTQLDEPDEGDDIGEEEADWVTRPGSLSTWDCPLCSLHGTFDTCEMLQYHLVKDHSEVETEWTQGTTENAGQCQLTITITPIVKSEKAPMSLYEEDETVQEENAVIEEELANEEEEEEEEEEIDQLDPTPRSSVQPAPPIRIKHEPAEDNALEPIDDTKNPEAQNQNRRASSLFAPDVTPEVHVRGQVDHLAPPPRSTSTRSSSFYTASLRTPTPAVSFRGSLPPRYPSPPPPDNPLGPAARSPYVKPGIRSCRPLCDPDEGMLYDILDELPLEPYGVLSWAILDREEEIFEMEDLREEDKVMLALWNRWSLLHRRKISLGNHYEGVIDFVNQYWETIHRGAGWQALSLFLVMLSKNRIINLSEAANVLRHYEEKTGMKHWYIKQENGSER